MVVAMHGHEVDVQFPLTQSWELSAPAYSMTPYELCEHALFNLTTIRVVDVKGKGAAASTYVDVTLIPGHPWHGPYGPQPCEVMIIGKRPGVEEVRLGRYLAGPSGEELNRVFQENGVDPSEFYVSNVVRFIPPDGGKNLKVHHIKDCAPLLARELIMVRPKYILLLGADAVKFLYGRRATLRSVRGAELSFMFKDIGKFPKRDPDESIAAITDQFATKVMATVNPAQVLSEPSLASGFEADIEVFSQLIKGERSRVVTAPGLAKDEEYHYIDNAEELSSLVDRLISEGYTKFAVDCEWGGENYRTGWLRTIQFSWGAKRAAVVILRRQGGDPSFSPNAVAAVDILRWLFERDGVEIIGHYFRADAPWLEELGLHLMRRLCFDTGLAAHLLNESAELSLVPGLSTRYTSMGRYDFELQSWVRSHPNLVKKTDGYGNIPDEIIHPYGAGDVDCTFRSYLVLDEELKRPEHADLLRLFHSIVMPAGQPIHEMEMTGILVDTDRMVELLRRYNTRKHELLDELRHKTHRPEFNPRSYKQKVELLYDSPQDGGLGFTPIKSTSKPAVEWARVQQMDAQERARMNPAVDAETLELLTSAEYASDYAREIAELLKKFQTIDQVTKNFLRLPEGQDEAVDFDQDIYTQGLLGHVDNDGRIRTSISQTKETGRYGSSRPNLQNITKRMEPVYAEIMGDKIPTIRSCLIASPGYVLIEADYKSAEIVTLAYVSGDQNLIDDANGPVKLHAKVAVDILKAPCTYAEVSEKYPKQYVGAKNINFGIPYQRGAKAIARQVNRETKATGSDIMTPEQAQSIIDAWYERYAGVRDYVNRCKEHVRYPPHFISTTYGRRRRFHSSHDESVMAAQEREAVNFPIQSTVADTLSVALSNLWRYRQDNPWCDYRILLAIHDAVLLEVKIEHIEHVIDFVLPDCMTRRARIPYLGFHLDIDPEICLRWGEHPSREELEVIGVPEKYLGSAKKPIGNPELLLADVEGGHARQ